METVPKRISPHRWVFACKRDSLSDCLIGNRGRRKSRPSEIADVANLRALNRVPGFEPVQLLASRTRGIFGPRTRGEGECQTSRCAALASTIISPEWRRAWATSFIQPGSIHVGRQGCLALVGVPCRVRPGWCKGEATLPSHLVSTGVGVAGLS